jgi:hypothetical protein
MLNILSQDARLYFRALLFLAHAAPLSERPGVLLPHHEDAAFDPRRNQRHPYGRAS